MNSEADKMWYDNRVEAFIDGDLPDNEARMFAARMALDDGLRRSVDQALALQGALQSIPPLRCPPHVTEAVLERTVGPRNWISHWAWPAAALAALLAVAVNLSGLLTSERTVDPLAPEPAIASVDAQPSAAELAQAREELAIALAYLDRASHIAGREVSKRMLTEGMAKPLSRGLHRVPAAHELEDAS